MLSEEQVNVLRHLSGGDLLAPLGELRKTYHLLLDKKHVPYRVYNGLRTRGFVEATDNPRYREPPRYKITDAGRAALKHSRNSKP